MGLYIKSLSLMKRLNPGSETIALYFFNQRI